MFVCVEYLIRILTNEISILGSHVKHYSQARIVCTIIASLHHYEDLN